MSQSKADASRLRIGILLAVTAIAAFLRLYRIDQLPPGDGYDPAYYGVDALQILRGARPVFFPTNFGREALFSYLVAGSVLIWGPTALAVHMASALVGIVTVPVIYLLAEELFAAEPTPVRIGGSTVAASMMAVSYWHLNWSRYGVRAILLPLFVALTIFYLWRTLRISDPGSRRNAVACGIALGLSLYTYQAARLLPLLVVVGFALRFLQQRAFDRRSVRNLLLIVLVSLVVFAPLGIYFLTHPGTFWERIRLALIFDASQDATENQEAFARQLLDALALFGVRGDVEPYSTIPGRPALDRFLAGLFWIGLATCLVQYRKPRFLLVVIGWGGMLLPATIASQAPAAKRAIGALPAVALLVAIGALSLWRALLRWGRGRSQQLRSLLQFGYVGLLAAGFLYSGFATYRDYFVIWPANPNLFTHFEVGVSRIGDYIHTLDPDERVYVSPDLPDHAGIRFHARLRADIRGYNGRACLVLPERTATSTTYIVAPSKDKHGLAQLQVHFPQGAIVYDGPLHYGEPYFRAYHIPAGHTARITPTHPVSIRWRSPIQLLGYDISEDTFRSGGAGTLTLYYQGEGPIETDYTAFVHLLGPPNPASGDALWAQNDSQPCYTYYPTSAWQPGEIVKDTISLQLPPDLPPGEYTLRTGFYDFATMARLPVTRGEAQDDIATLGTLQIESSLP